MLPVKITAEQRKRFKVAAAEAELSYGAFLLHLLDERDRRLANQRRGQVHPFHRPTIPEETVTL